MCYIGSVGRIRIEVVEVRYIYVGVVIISND